MVYLEEWTDFQTAVEELYLTSPYKSQRTKLKIAMNNEQCLKYKTDKMQDLRKLQQLNSSLMVKMQNKQPVPVPPTPQPGSEVPTPADTPKAQHTGGGKSSKKKRKK
ncbi:hypothetical protein HDU76_011964 [Blyttiomyces sp. JEL0837]|nr:hypothetical protein HDU76_011964 [Blyttiomyces sp. JEL0837]